jgi:ParB family chromosome partitioning protein
MNHDQERDRATRAERARVALEFGLPLPASAEQQGEQAAEEHRPDDSAGINAVVPLTALAAHPENPRTNLGDLAELAASIASQGLFEPLIVLTAAAYAREGGQEGYPGEGITHVIVMGHRRAAAAALAEASEVMVIVRDDLAGAPAIAAMIAENRHRQDLDPLAEARAMAALVRRHGWPQRRVAEEIGCSQAHVSKRMSLLQLPGVARDALAGGKVSVETALELHKLTGAGVEVARRRPSPKRSASCSAAWPRTTPSRAPGTRSSAPPRARRPGRTWRPAASRSSPSRSGPG